MEGRAGEPDPSPGQLLLNPKILALPLCPPSSTTPAPSRPPPYEGRLNQHTLSALPPDPPTPPYYLLSLTERTTWSKVERSSWSGKVFCHAEAVYWIEFCFSFGVDDYCVGFRYYTGNLLQVAVLHVCLHKCFPYGWMCKGTVET